MFILAKSVTVSVLMVWGLEFSLKVWTRFRFVQELECSSPSICCRPELNTGHYCLLSCCQNPHLFFPSSSLYRDECLLILNCALIPFLSNLYPPSPRSRASAAFCQPHRHPSSVATSLRIHPAAQQPGKCNRSGLPSQLWAGLLVGCDVGPHHEGQPKRL